MRGQKLKSNFSIELPPPRLTRRRYLLCGLATASILLGVVLTFSAPAATPAGFIVVVAMGFNSIGKKCLKCMECQTGLVL